MYNDDQFSLSHNFSQKPDPSQFRLHTHAKAELYYFVRGAGTFHIEGSAYPLEQGDLLLLQSAESHYIEVDTNQPYERKVLHFDLGALKSIDPHGHLSQPFLDREPGKQNLYKAFRFPGGSCEGYFDTMLSPDPDPRVNIFAGLIPLLHILSRLHAEPAAQQQPDPVEYQIMRYLNENIGSSITLDDICQRFYISKSQLCRVFRDSTGVSVKHYLTVKRLVKAKQLIDAGQPPTHVYPQCGFHDYSGFYRAYRKHYGETPGNRKK